MKYKKDMIQSFLTTAKNNQNKEIVYTNSKVYTYGELVNRYDKIRKKTMEKFLKTPERNILAISDVDCIDTILYYFIAAELEKDFLLLPSNISFSEREDIQKKLNMQGNMPFRGMTAISMTENGNHFNGGEVIFQTNGTSGIKKYVRISYEDFYTQMMITHEYDYVMEDEVKLLLIPVWKQLGIKELIRSLLLNVRVCVPTNLEIDSIIECLKQVKVTGLILKSSILSGILYHEKFEKRYLENVKILRYCQEPLQMDTLLQMQSLFPYVKFYSDFGLTETIGTIAIMGPEVHLDARYKHHLPTVGNFLPGVEIKLVDQDGNDVKKGEVGELLVHSPQQFLGYVGSGKSEYWIATGDMGWLDSDGFFNLSGFRKETIRKTKGQLFILPAVARKQYVSVPLSEYLMNHESRVAELFQTLLILIHASLNVDEIKHYYLDFIPKIIEADAYGFDLFPLESYPKGGWVRTADQSWYQDALGISTCHKIFLKDKVYKKSIPLDMIEEYYEEAVDIVYLPLFSPTEQLHGVISLARSVQKGKFCAKEMTMLKQISHHLNLALLNARLFQEIQMRQVMLENTIDLSDVGIILSDLSDTIYYMNSSVKKMLDNEDISKLKYSSLLEHVMDNIYHLKFYGEQEFSSQFACYFKNSMLPIMIKIRSVKLSLDASYVTSFISQNFDKEDMSFGDLENELSAKELEVLTLLCQGLSYKNIAQKLCVSVNTINFHIKNIYRKMNVTSRNELLNHVLYLGKNGFHFSMVEEDQK